jgi:low affinity Fe/Cu permease
VKTKKESSEHNSEKEKKEKSKVSRFFSRFSTVVTKATGSAYAFIIAAVVVILWAVTGPIFKFSDTWQLVINTGTTIITFLMVFIIQHSQNKDTVALQLKLNELIAASEAPSNKLIGIEDLDDDELELLRKFYEHLSGLSKEEKKDKMKSLEEEAKIEKEIEKEEQEVEKARNQGPPKRQKTNKN